MIEYVYVDVHVSDCVDLMLQSFVSMYLSYLLNGYMLIGAGPAN